MILERLCTLRIASTGQFDLRVRPVHVEPRDRILVVSHHHEVRRGRCVASVGQVEGFEYDEVSGAILDDRYCLALASEDLDLSGQLPRHHSTYPKLRLPGISRKRCPGLTCTSWSRPTGVPPVGSPSPCSRNRSLSSPNPASARSSRPDIASPGPSYFALLRKVGISIGALLCPSARTSV